MKVAYLILAHNNPLHLKRLIDRLSTGNSIFFVHIDAKSDIDIFKSCVADNVHFLQNRVLCGWGGFTLVQATLELMKTALSHCKFDRAVLLSGADYPVRSTDYIEQFFDANSNHEFMNVCAMPSVEFSKPLSRLVHYRIGDSTFKPKAYLIKFLIKFKLLSRDYSKILGDLKPYAGSQWWALTFSACSYIVDFAHKNKEIVDFYKNTEVPDEMFFQTILGNSEFMSNKKNAIIYADWSQGGKSPAMFSESNYKYLSSVKFKIDMRSLGTSEILFARKFNDDSQEVIAKIDETY